MQSAQGVAASFLLRKPSASGNSSIAAKASHNEKVAGQQEEVISCGAGSRRVVPLSFRSMDTPDLNLV